MKNLVFIIGAGRTGSTIFHRILCDHPQTSWLTSLADRYPNRPGLQRRFLNTVDLPIIGKFLNRVYPSECYDFWDYHCPGFRRPCRDLIAEDVTNRSANRIRDCLSQIPPRSRPHLTIKLTGWPRIGYLAKIFPEAKFVHLQRHGCSVANSFLNVSWWNGWQGPSNWRWGALSADLKDEWLRHNRSFIALAGIQWKIYQDAYKKAAARLPASQLLELRYENVCNDPESSFERFLTFTDIPLQDAFFKRLNHYELRSTGDKWKKELTGEQQKILLEVLGNSLTELGYETG